MGVGALPRRGDRQRPVDLATGGTHRRRGRRSERPVDLATGGGTSRTFLARFILPRSYRGDRVGSSNAPAGPIGGVGKRCCLDGLRAWRGPSDQSGEPVPRGRSSRGLSYRGGIAVTVSVVRREPFPLAGTWYDLNAARARPKRGELRRRWEISSAYSELADLPDRKNPKDTYESRSLANLVHYRCDPSLSR